jgi:hypothetical protein
MSVKLILDMLNTIPQMMIALIILILALIGDNHAVTFVRTGYTFKSSGLQYPANRLLQCARELRWTHTESATISASGTCSFLAREWLENKTMLTDMDYVTSAVKDLNFQIPVSEIYVSQNKIILLSMYLKNKSK